ncbi:MAG: ATP-dependent Clp protease proteolytic subunit [Candidatus Bathyarchaeia archaeon]
MDIFELTLGMGVLIVSALNSMALLYLIRPRKPQTVELEGETGKEEEEKTKEEEEPQAAQPAAPQRPTTKAGILAWRRRILEELGEERGTKVITMIHKKELWTEEGEEPEIGIEDIEAVLQAFRKTPPSKPIDLILHTPGGYASAAQMMAMAIKFHPAKVTVMVPFYAMSGGSLMSLAANEIRMEKYSVLGPVDPQIPTPDGMWPAGSLSTLVKTKPIQNITDRMIILSDAANLEIENAKAFVTWLLDGKMDKEQAERVADFLAKGYMSHATPITLDVARALGLNVVEGIPDKVYELFKTFAFTGQPYKRS